ncbi:MAG TPA: iron-containing redox enzyme family protein [Burkholderiales bacterium]|nr:iron-containing redox enzyme family protein [Burkholderiales bacterium]
MHYEELCRRTEDARAALVAIPVIRACLAGRVTRTQYLAFLGEAYHHVRHTVPLLMACGSRLKGETASWLRPALAEYIAEESGHEEWILEDIAASGGDADEARRRPPGSATEVMVAYAYDTIARRNPVGFLGMVHVLEGTSVALASRAAAAMRGALGLPASAFTYLSSHGSLDQQHVRTFARLVERLDEEDRADVAHVARMMYRLYGDIFRSLPA